MIENALKDDFTEEEITEIKEIHKAYLAYETLPFYGIPPPVEFIKIYLASFLRAVKDFISIKEMRSPQ